MSYFSLALLPYCLRVLAENVLRHVGHNGVTEAGLAALRDAIAKLGGDPRRINPQIPVDLVIDHSLSVDAGRMCRAEIPETVT